MFGGFEGPTDFNDTWVYDPTTNRWRNLRPSGLAPSARAGASLAYDSSTDQVIMSGGSTNDGSPFNDTWAYDPAANRWIELLPSGIAPSGPMVYDAPSGKVLLFGEGATNSTTVTDTWAYTP